MTDIKNDENHLLIKFFDQQYLENLEERNIHFSNLNTFTKNDKNLTSAQNDDQEGKHKTIFDSQKINIVIRPTGSSEEIPVEFDSGEQNLSLPKNDAEKMYITSFVALNMSSDFEEQGNQFFIKPNVLEDITEIANKRPFVLIMEDQLLKTLKTIPGVTYAHEISYLSDRDFPQLTSDKDIVKLAFTKDKKYAGQREYRVLVNREDGTQPEDIKLPLMKGENGFTFVFEDLKTLSWSHVKKDNI